MPSVFCVSRRKGTQTERKALASDKSLSKEKMASKFKTEFCQFYLFEIPIEIKSIKKKSVIALDNSTFCARNLTTLEISAKIVQKFKVRKVELTGTVTNTSF